MSDLNKGQKILMSVAYVLTGFALLVISFVLFNIVQREKPKTLGTIYAGTLTCSSEDVNIIEVNIYSNENKNGQVCYEVLWNGYTDYLGREIKGFGMQSSVLPKSHNYSMVPEDSIFLVADAESPYIVNFPEATMYNTDDLGLSSHVIADMPNELYFDIDGKMFKYEFQTFNREVYSTKGWNFFNAVFDITTTEKISFNYNTLFNVIVRSALTDSAKENYSEFAINMLDLDQYLKILYLDDNNQYQPLPKTSSMYKLFKVKVNFSKDGMTDVNQSLFKQFKGSSSWDYYSKTGVEEYWNAYTELVLTENNINFVYNEVESSYCVILDEKFSNYLDGLKNAEISIVLDLSALDFKVYGIDLKNFNFRISDFEILSNSFDNFKIYNLDSCSVEPMLRVV